MSDEKSPTEMTAGELSKYLGTDAAVWAEVFTKLFDMRHVGDARGWTKDEVFSTMLGWFANAIETGRSAGRALSDEQQHEISRIVGETCGTVSMCWVPPPETQVFDAGPAGAYVDAGVREIVRTVQGYVLP